MPNLTALKGAIAELDRAREDTPSEGAVARLGNLAWSHYYARLDAATQGLESAARVLVGLHQEDNA